MTEAMLPLVPLVSLAMVASGGVLGAGYAMLTPRQQKEANKLAAQIMQDWFGVKSAARLTADQAAKVVDYVNSRFRQTT